MIINRSANEHKYSSSIMPTQAAFSLTYWLWITSDFLPSICSGATGALLVSGHAGWEKNSLAMAVVTCCYSWISCFSLFAYITWLVGFCLLTGNSCVVRKVWRIWGRLWVRGPLYSVLNWWWTFWFRGWTRGSQGYILRWRSVCCALGNVLPAQMPW